METNKLIAEFLGWTLDDKLYRKKVGSKFIYKSFDFNSDWNLLMEVVEKIENIEFKGQVFSFEINRNRTHIFYAPANYSNEKWFSNIFLHEGNEKVENTYNACVEFIKWYNNEK